MERARVLRWGASVTIAFGIGACGGDRMAEPPATVVRDSSGVRIVENGRVPDSLTSGLVVSPSPRFTVGGLDAPADRQLSQVSGGTVLSDGAVALFDGGSHEVRIYAPEGVLRVRWGGEGEGPGEFGGATLLGTLPGDTLVVWDAGQRRLSLVSPTAGFVRSVTAESHAGGFPVGLGLLDGGWAVFGGGLFFSSADGFPEGRIRTDSDYRTLHVDGRTGPPLGSFPGPEMFARVSGTSFSARGIPFGLRTVAASAGEVVWVATGEAWELRAWAPGGELRAIVRADVPPIPVTEALVEAWIEERLDDVDPADRAATRRELADLPRGANVPPFSALVAGPGGELWARDGERPGRDTVAWTVIAPDGSLRARVQLPTRWRLLEVRSDGLLVLDRDDLDVEQVRIHALTRAGTPRPEGPTP